MKKQIPIPFEAAGENRHGDTLDEETSSLFLFDGENDSRTVKMTGERGLGVRNPSWASFIPLSGLEATIA